jgi:hypothetical protein
MSRLDLKFLETRLLTKKIKTSGRKEVPLLEDKTLHSA